jgi:hypothetical protein
MSGSDKWSDLPGQEKKTFGGYTYVMLSKAKHLSPAWTSERSRVRGILRRPPQDDPLQGKHLPTASVMLSKAQHLSDCLDNKAVRGQRTFGGSLRMTRLRGRHLDAASVMLSIAKHLSDCLGVRAAQGKRDPSAAASG